MNENEENTVRKINNELAGNTFFIAKSLLKYWRERSGKYEKKLYAADEIINTLQRDIKGIKNAYNREVSEHNRLKHEVAQHRSWGKYLY